VNDEKGNQSVHPGRPVDSGVLGVGAAEMNITEQKIKALDDNDAVFTAKTAISICWGADLKKLLAQRDALLEAAKDFRDDSESLEYCTALGDAIRLCDPLWKP
jgi:hypothetical protein